jgi:hypothetical protein
MASKPTSSSALLCCCARCGRPVQTYWPPTFVQSHQLLCLACDPAAPKDRKA